MLLKIVASSIRFRLHLYIPMVIAVVISLSLIGACEIVGRSFNDIVKREMGKYGANVILIPEGNGKVKEGVGVSVKRARFGREEISLATTKISDILQMNGAWMVRGKGSILVGRNAAEKLSIFEGKPLEIEKTKGIAAILDSGTEFDDFIIINGAIESPSMILIKTDDPQRFRGMNALILEEMFRVKYGFLMTMKKFLAYVSIILFAASMGAVMNLARMDAEKRRKEFGVFRALGATSYTVTKTLLPEFVVLSFVSGILGLLSSIALSWGILPFSAGSSLAIGTRTLLYVFVTSFVAFGSASLIYVLGSARQDVVEEIRGE